MLLYEHSSLPAIKCFTHTRQSFVGGSSLLIRLSHKFLLAKLNSWIMGPLFSEVLCREKNLIGSLPLLLWQPMTVQMTIFAYSESKLTFHFVVVVVLLVVVLRRKVEKDGNAKKGPFY